MKSRAELVWATGLALAALALACARPAPRPAEPEPVLPRVPPPEERVPAPSPPCLRIDRLVVHKGERKLWARCAGGAVVVLPVALGRAPEGAKERVGDQRTPEGDYHVAGRAVASRFHRFLPIDYPSQADADRAVAERRLSPGDHARIAAAHHRGVLPPQDTPLGGGLGLHGEGARWRGESRSLDWTEGCIALQDADLDFVVARVRVGTPVTILGAEAPLPSFATPDAVRAAPP